MADRPTLLTVLAVLWIILAALTFMSSAGMLTLWYGGGLAEAMPQPRVHNLPPVLEFFRYYGPLLAVQLVLSVVAGVSAVGLLKVKKWARTSLVALSWFGIVAAVAMAAAQAWFLVPLSAEIGAPEPRAVVFVAVGAVLLLVAGGAPFVLTLWALRRPAVTVAFGL